jgi:hypothetical protein
MFLVVHKIRLFYIHLFLFILFAAWSVYGNAVNTPSLANVDATGSIIESGLPTLIQHSLYKRSESSQSTSTSTPTNKPSDNWERTKKILMIVFGICGIPILAALVCIGGFCLGVFRGTKDQVKQHRERREQEEQVRLATFNYESYP